MFIPGTYTRIRNQVHNKAYVDVSGYGFFELHLAYQDSHARQFKIKVAHTPFMTHHDTPSVLSQKHLSKAHNIGFDCPATW
jgi:hypothetical protein